MKKITTGDFARALAPDLPIVSDDMVRSWCESGDLDAWRNPLAGAAWWFIKPNGVKTFLLNKLLLTQEQANGVLKRLGVNFNQMHLALTA